MSTIHPETDITIMGGGFAGSILAMALRQRGLSVALLERHRHPRFAIGESSTPSANFALSRIATKYKLDQLQSLVHYGSWRTNHPDIACGCKRGFSYFYHQRNQPFIQTLTHATELLVAANPSISVADTHWFRADTDQYLFNCANQLAATTLDECDVQSIQQDGQWQIDLQRPDGAYQLHTEFVVDATGGSAPLAQAVGLESLSETVRTNSRAVFAHFRNVKPWVDILHANGFSTNDYPFACDDAALHHLFDGGWMWILRFENGITSAGFVVDNSRFPVNVEATAEQEWNSFLATFPSIAEMFKDAECVTPLVQTPRIQKLHTPMAGDNWALLPSAAGFVDPLHSTGIAHALTGIERLADILTSCDRNEQPEALSAYSEKTLHEFRMIDRIVHMGYLTSNDMDAFISTSMLYFLGAIYSEHKARHESCFACGFLSFDDQSYCEMVNDAYAKTIAGTPPSIDALLPRARPFNVAGLCDPSKHNMYEYV